MQSSNNNIAAWPGLTLDEFPKLKEWLERMESRPAIEAGWNVPTPRVKLNLSEEELEAKAKQSREWIQKGMAEISKK